VEPLEPNITALSDPKNIKWKKFLSEGIEIPTTWNKEEYDKTNFIWQGLRKKLNKKISDHKRTGASVGEISTAEAEYDKRNIEATERMTAILQKDSSFNKVGAFEGAGYSATGLYRPMINCIMFSIGNIPFCKVCEDAINQVINHYLEN
ncbi:MAG: M64 family metallopeptidase, partial [Calditrichia bacterium]